MAKNWGKVIGQSDVAKGGILPGQIVAEYLSCPLFLVSVSRPMTSVKERIRLDKLPEAIKNALRRLEMTLGLYKLLGNRTVSRFPVDLPAGQGVIVDDSLDTGRTLKAVLNNLRDQTGRQRHDVLIAVLTQIFDDAQPSCDLSIFRNVNIRFPWSQDSTEYSLFLEFCQTHGFSTLL